MLRHLQKYVSQVVFCTYSCEMMKAILLLGDATIIRLQHKL